MLRNDALRYGALAKALHWVMALLIIGMLAMGLYMTGLEVGPDMFKLYGWHKATGMVVLALLLVRFSWRMMNITPSLPADFDKLQTLAAHGGHFGLYALMLAMPVSGWLMSSAAGFPVSVFGLFTMPNLIAPTPEWVDFLKEAHEWMAFGLMGLIGAHVGAALYHHFIRKDSILKRMLPWGKI